LENKNYCKTIRYAIIEVNPSFLQHKIPLIQIFNYIVYWGASIYFLIRNFIFNLLSGITNATEYITAFFKKKITTNKKGIDINFELNNNQINKRDLKNPLINLDIDDISLLPSYLIYKKEIEFFYNKEGLKKIKEIQSQYHIKFPEFNSKNIVLKKETFYISKEISQLCNKITITISYNQAAMFTLNILNKLKILKKEKYE